MNSDSFFDILGEINDDIISEAAALPEKNIRKKGEIRTFFLIAACLAALIVSGFILSESIKTGNVSVYETTAENSVSVSEESITVEIEKTSAVADISEAEPSAEITEAPSSSEKLSEEPAEEEITTQKISGSENTVTSPYIPENTEPTEKPSEEEERTEDKTTGNSILNIIPPFIENLFPQLGDTAASPNQKGYFFHEVPAISFLEKLPPDSFDKNIYINTESVSWNTLEEIYGTKIVPDLNLSSDNLTVDGIADYEIYNKMHTVRFNEDKTEVFSSQEFSFNISSGILTVKVSTEEFPLYNKEKELKSSKSLINDTPVLLISGKTLGRVTFLDALFEKNGVFFRVTLKGTNLNEEEFINIIKSLF